MIWGIDNSTKYVPNVPASYEQDLRFLWRSRMEEKFRWSVPDGIQILL